MKRLVPLFAVVVFVGVLWVNRAQPQKQAGPDETARAAAVKLWESLTDAQKKLALKDVADKERYVEQFPEVKRPGLPFKDLTAEQKTLANDAVRAMLSDYGATRCLEVAKQTSPGGLYVNFFGAPEAGKAFAWRVAGHHLTLLYAEFGTGKAPEFGPVLLGGNPAKNLWDEEENLVLELYKSLTPKEQEAIRIGKANSGSGSPIGTSGMLIGELGEKSQGLAKKLLRQRVAVFNADRQKILDDLIQREGGADKLRIKIWGEATKSHRDGGNYHWRIGSEYLTADWQTAGKNHIHMTVRVRKKT